MPAPSSAPVAQPGPVFVVGPSRSGTTLMSRVIAGGTHVHSTTEIHFFERLWDPSGPSGPLERGAAVALAARLVHTQHRGVFYKQGSADDHLAEGERIVDSIDGDATPLAVYAAFLRAIAAAKGKTVGCDQTPRNVFYLQEILDAFPDARVVVMVRDPRAVMLSQKNKWRRRSLGESALPRSEVVRSWSNYHPAVTARLWRGAVEAGERAAAQDARVIVVRFEDLLQDPEAVGRRVAEHVGVEYSAAMLDVPQASSSIASDTGDERGLRVQMAEAWRDHGGLSKSEIAMCERVCGDAMARHGYRTDEHRLGPVAVAGWYGLLVPKLGLAAVMNARQIGNPVTAVRRRLSR